MFARFTSGVLCFLILCRSFDVSDVLFLGMPILVTVLLVYFTMLLSIHFMGIPLISALTRGNPTPFNVPTIT